MRQPLLAYLAVDEAPAVPPRRVPVRAHSRRVTGEAPTTGKEDRDAALMHHEARAAVRGALEYVRTKLRELYRSRLARSTDAFVTADDIETILRNWPLCPDEATTSYGPQHWRGSVFRERGWQLTGTSVPALRKHMRATTLPAWRFVDPSPAPRTP